MENKDAVTALAALAQKSRLAIFRMLLRNDPDGLTPHAIGKQLGLPGATLSFHLKVLMQGGWVAVEQDGRFLHYRAKKTCINVLIDFLTHDCCGGNSQLCATERKNS